MTRQYFGSGRHSDGVYRSCSRCGRELTDSASRECGVGPVCRKKDNAIFARQIPANLSMALVTVLELSADSFHTEISDNFEAVRVAFLRKTEAARVTFGEDQMATIPGADFRDTVDWLDMSLSYRTSQAHRKLVIGLIDDLGYVSLASVLRGDACMSPATLELDGTRILLKGKSNKAGWKALKSAFGANVKTPRYRGDTTPYSVHVGNADKFVELALKHWPFMKDLEEVNGLLEQAAEIDANSEPVDARPVAKFELIPQTNLFRVTVPWTGTRTDMQRMFTMFKEVPKSDRTFNPRTKAWTFEAKHKRHVRWSVERTGLYQMPAVGLLFSSVL